MPCIPCAIAVLAADGPSLETLLADARQPDTGYACDHDPGATHGADAPTPPGACPTCHAAAVVLSADPAFRAVVQRYPNAKMALCADCRDKSRTRVYGDDSPGAIVTLTSSVTQPDGSILNTYSDGSTSTAQPGSTWLTQTAVSADGTTVTSTWSDGTTTTAPSSQSTNATQDAAIAQGNAASASATAQQNAISAIGAASAPGATSDQLANAIQMAIAAGPSAVALATQLGLIKGPVGAKGPAGAPQAPPPKPPAKKDYTLYIALGAAAALVILYLVTLPPKTPNQGPGAPAGQNPQFS